MGVLGVALPSGIAVVLSSNFGLVFGTYFRSDCVLILFSAPKKWGEGDRRDRYALRTDRGMSAVRKREKGVSLHTGKR